MTSRVKEDERIEKIIRGLLKLPENKRCINCNSLGPQYVCTTFWTFVCTTCSGVHREFTHRVKSVSMAKFTAEEVSALQAGGNERARQIYLKVWDPQRHSFPDASNLHKLREYIKHVYVDRKYAGQRNTDTLPPVKLNKRNENYDRKTSADTYGRHSYERPGSSGRPDLKYYHDEWRSSPRYARENSRSGGFKRSPIQFEVVDDRFRDDENTRGRKSDPRRTASVEVMARSRSPVPQKIVNRSMSPVIRPVADLLGENVPHLQVGGPSKGNKEKNADASPNRQKDPSSDVGGSITDGQAPEDKRQESTSLIDFDMDPNPPSSETTADKQTKISAQFTSVTTSAIAEIPRDQSITTLESLLFELNAPANAVSANEQQGDNKDDTSTVPPENTSAPAGETKPARGTSESAATEVTHGQQSGVTSENQAAPSSSFESNSIAPQYGSYVDIDNSQGQSNTSLEQSIQAVSLGTHDRSSISAPNTPVEASTTWRYEPPTRKELPADLFSLSYPPVAAPVAGWQTGQPHAMGFGIHYHPTAYQTGGFPNSVGSTNPFDLSDGDGSRPDQREMFPSMASVQGALSSVPVSTGFLNTPVSGTQLTSYSLYSSVPGADTGHQPPAGPPTGPQGFGAASISNAFDFGSLGSSQPSTNRSSAPITQHSFPSTKSNPFE